MFWPVMTFIKCEMQCYIINIHMILETRQYCNTIAKVLLRQCTHIVLYFNVQTFLLCTR